jgi:hypothetical protein
MEPASLRLAIGLRLAAHPPRCWAGLKKVEVSLMEKIRTMMPAEQIALWADRLRDISAMGLHFSKNIHDKEAFRAVQTIAMEMLALATGETVEHMEPLRTSVFPAQPQ